jgi:alanine racemase
MIMSHLSCGNDPCNKKNEEQLKRFQEISKYFPNVKKSLSNSAGILLGRKYDFDLVRPGISLYGGDATINQRSIYKNVISLKAKIIQTRKINQFDTVGYGATFKAKKEMLIGTIPIGYADGFFRVFSGKINFYFKKSKIKMIGNVSMDLITVDLSKHMDIKIKQTDYVEIINEKNNINVLSKIISTIPYEILTSLGNRYQRRYIA